MADVAAALLESGYQRALRDRRRSIRRSTLELSALDHPFDCLARDAERPGSDAEVDIIVRFGPRSGQRRGEGRIRSRILGGDRLQVLDFLRLRWRCLWLEPRKIHQLLQR